LKSFALAAAKSVFRTFGLEVQFARSALTECNVLQGLFKRNRINTIIDVGANHGQFAQQCRKLGYRGRLISFEPLSDAHSVLKSRAGKDPDWVIAERSALGSTEGNVNINVAANSASSSLLPMLEYHRQAAPQSTYVAMETAPLKTLDNAMEPYLPLGDGYLKIDTQGYELEVLRGGTKTIRQCIAIQSELSFVELYRGQPLFLDICTHLAGHGFVLRYLIPGFRDRRTGELLQADGVFLRALAGHPEN
jgi:FkbM family methyltransferase